MIDTNFPLIEYTKGKSFQEWGISHGESYRMAIKELAEIRRELMLAKNPALKSKIDELALKQYEVSKNYCPELTSEMDGIATGSDLSISDIIIVNNYTDFRDIELPEEGCSTLHLQNPTNSVAGQTWDMHKSAKNYICLIKLPETEHHGETIVFSLVGCLGMMGLNSKKCFVGVNNINTKNARAGLVWPLLVRRTLWEKTYQGMSDVLFNAPVTSGHNYIIADNNNGAHLEITPTQKETASKLENDQEGFIFHTNHCLTKNVIAEEDPLAQSSTSHVRYKTIEKNSTRTKTFNEMIELLKSHEGYPKSICSHYESGAQDPSFTCGGGVSDLNSGKFHLWRGCEQEDGDRYKEYNFKLSENTFSLEDK